MYNPSSILEGLRRDVAVRASVVGLIGLILAAPAAADVTIHCIDVGQGDCTLVVSSSGQTMLIDAGWNGRGNDTVVPYMNSLGLGSLDYMLASHYHADHIGGLDEVYYAKGVDVACYDRGWSYTTVTYSNYASAIASKRATVTDGQVIDMGDDVTVRVLGVNGNGQLSSPFNNSSYENEYDLAVMVECGDFDFFVAGDLIGTSSSGHKDIETGLAPETGEIEVYRVSHHGSYTSSNSTFMTATLPEVSIISVGSNSYGHPHQEALNRMSSVGSFVYQTGTGSGGTLPPEELRVVGGTVVITTDGFGEYFVDGDQWTMDEEDLSTVPMVARFELRGNYPNPFNPATTISFETAQGGPARLAVFDVTGRRVYDEVFTVGRGSQSVVWNGVDRRGEPLPSGVYLYRIVAPGGAGTGRMSLIK